MNAVTLLLTIAVANGERETVETFPSMAACERAGLGMVSAGQPGWTVTFECIPHLRIAPNAHADQNTDAAR